MQDYQMLIDQHSEELTQLLEYFGESQEDIFHQLMELGSKSQRAEAITVPDNDSVGQNEPQPNPNDGPEVTTTPRNPSEDGGTEDQRPDNSLRQKEPSPNPQRQVPDTIPTKHLQTSRRLRCMVNEQSRVKWTTWKPTQQPSVSAKHLRTSRRLRCMANE